MCDLTEPLGLTQPTVSHHLKVLVDAGRALEFAKGNRVEAARLLGIGERTLYRKLERYEQRQKSDQRGDDRLVESSP